MHSFVAPPIQDLSVSFPEISQKFLALLERFMDHQVRGDDRLSMIANWMALAMCFCTGKNMLGP